MEDEVCILLSTFNGGKFLTEQIESLLSQKGVKCRILVRDDGSTDDTKKILQYYKNKNVLDWYSGENLKPAFSFFDLVTNAPCCEYYAFCDQDDVWLDDKLKISLQFLKKGNPNVPALYYGRPRLADHSLNLIKNSEGSTHKMLDFGSSIINSNATGCTMVFNRKLLEIVRKKHPKYISMHDSWFHKVCLISSGNIYFDEDVHILYRQHSNNQIGITTSRYKAFIKHIKSMKSKEKSRSKMVSSLLECYRNEMSFEDKKMATLVANYDKNLISWMSLLFDTTIKCNYSKRNLYYKIAVLLRIF